MLRKSPLSRATPLRRSKPMARRRKRTPAPDRAYMGRIAAMPCLACGAPPPSTVHHVTASIHGGRITRSNYRVVPLCPTHHQIQHGPRESVEALGHGGFFATYNIDLLAVADRLFREAAHVR